MMPNEPISRNFDEGIDLLALGRVVWNYKWLIVVFSFLFVVATVFVALAATEIYRAEVVVTPVDDQGLGGVARLPVNSAGLRALPV